MIVRLHVNAVRFFVQPSGRLTRPSCAATALRHDEPLRPLPFAVIGAYARSSSSNIDIAAIIAVKTR